MRGKIYNCMISMLMLMLLRAVNVSCINTLSGCDEKCGDILIPYPFGIGPDCSINSNFTITCNQTLPGVYKPFLIEAEIISISITSANFRTYNQISWQCYDPSLRNTTSTVWWIDFSDGPLRFSYVHNKFTSIGCDSLAYIQGDGNNETLNYESGCVSVCGKLDMVPDNSDCSGFGCCQTAIPNNIAYYQVVFDASFNNSRVYQFNPCSYAVLVEAEWFEFRKSYITTTEFNQTNDGQVPVVLDWRMGDQTCDRVRKSDPLYACKSEHSVCVNSTNGPGYLCNCTSGYQGNPYLKHGCQDIDECSNESQYPCSDTANCSNTQGSFVCSCPPGTRGNPHVGGICSSLDNHTVLSFTNKLVIGICVSLVTLFSAGILIFLIYERRKMKRIKEKNFQENGGQQLLDELKSMHGLQFKLFTREELEIATNKFDKKNILGQGGQGTVYKGILKDDRLVAIKMSKLINEEQKKGFGKEIFILSQINHKNIVKILGCCLEVQVPMLVYEFVSNGTLFDFIHRRRLRMPIPLRTRVRIALESAEALAYLHSAAFPPILHRDVKSSNILIDENYMAKVSDFGTSILVPMDKTELATLVQGTYGYLDPECIQTWQLTDKSDVYSFGVVILELLTRKKAIYFDGPEDERSLALHFLEVLKRNKLWDIVDAEIRNEGDLEQIEEIAELAKQCLSLKGEDRPTMKEVAEKLQWISKYNSEHPWMQTEPQEIQTLLVEDHNSSLFSTTDGGTIDIFTGR